MDNLAAYTAVPYEGQVTAQTDPDNLAVVGTLLGLSPVALSEARTLEIGCADGGNLVPMAGRFPTASFVGLDLTPSLIERAQAYSNRAGLTNIDWLAADISDPELDLGPFDYIIVHGVWSWVPPAVRTAILRRCADWLSPNGLATISYNVWPGWSLRSPMRGMLAWHANHAPDAEQRIARARQLATWLTDLPTNRRLLGSAMRGELADVADMTDWYLFHEHLAKDNHPVWFHEFAALAAENGLEYVGDAEFADMVPVDLPSDVQDGLEALATDRLSYEQYLDFARERAFRRTVVAPAGTAVDYGVTSDRLAGLHVGGRLFFAADWTDDDEPQGVTCWPMGVRPKTPDGLVGFVALNQPHKQMWRRIADAWPSTISVVDAIAGLEDDQGLRQQLLIAYLQHGVRLFTQPRVSHGVTERPCARQAVRAEAHLEREWLTTAWHRSLGASDMDRALLRILNGEHTVETIAADMQRSFSRGTLPVPKDLGDTGLEHVRQWLDTRLSAYANALLLEHP
jgi:hypothetical protein